MMVKRMNYIRNTLDQHDPHAATEIIRKTANKKKEHRIIELWKEDMSQPKVGDLIKKMQKLKDAEDRNDFPDVLALPAPSTANDNAVDRSFDSDVIGTPPANR